jgi:hypothetical protein
VLGMQHFHKTKMILIQSTMVTHMNPIQGRLMTVGHSWYFSAFQAHLFPHFQIGRLGR